VKAEHTYRKFQVPGTAQVLQCVSLDQPGQVRYSYSHWVAELEPNHSCNLIPGVQVAVVGIRKSGPLVTLIVAPQTHATHTWDASSQDLALAA
jgi:hypothetical protein